MRYERANRASEWAALIGTVLGYCVLALLLWLAATLLWGTL